MAHEFESLVVENSESSTTGHGTSTESSSRRFRVLCGLSMMVGLFLCRNALPKPLADPSPQSSTDAHSSVWESQPAHHINLTEGHSISGDDSSSPVNLNDETPTPQKEMKEITCQVPVTDSDIAPKLSRKSSASVFSKCSSTMGKRLTKSRKKLVAKLPKNRQAHIFSFPWAVRDDQGYRPRLCVPQKNGNKQFGGLVYAAWHKKPAISGEGVDKDMHRWQTHELKRRSRADRESHVYFVARNPYTRILSLYLQKVVHACISDGQKGCDRHNWRGISPKTSFKDFVSILEEKATRHDSLCEMNHHLCQQVESCLTTTQVAQEVTILRIEEQSCWFPCFIKQIGIKTDVLKKGWEDFSGRSCYYSATESCKNMLQSIDPNKVGVTTGNVHATGASSKLAEHYDAETAAIVTRLFADDFRILGYPIWDGVTSF